MATSKVTSVEMLDKDQLDVWVYTRAGTKILATINIKTDSGKVIITTDGAEVVCERGQQ